MAERKTKTSAELTRMLDEHEKVEQLVNLFVLGLFLVLVMYLYLV